MQLRQIEYFIAVAEEGNFSAAALRLHISQPPITRQIHKLEEELGVTLLNRTPKGTIPTPAGQIFLADMRQILAHIARATERCRATQRGELGTLEVGYFGSPIYSLVPKLLKSFRKSLPNVEVTLHRLSKNQQIAALKSGHIHIGFGRYYPSEPDIVIEQIITEGLAIAVPADFEYDLAPSEIFTIFDHMPLILFPKNGRPNFADDVIDSLKKERIEPNIKMIAEDIRSALTQTAIGAGATIVPGTMERLSWAGVRIIPLDSFNKSCPVNCVYRRSDNSPLLRSIQSTIQDYRRDFVAGDTA